MRQQERRALVGLVPYFHISGRKDSLFIETSIFIKYELTLNIIEIIYELLPFILSFESYQKSQKYLSGYCLFLVLLEFDGERGIKLELMIITIFIFSWRNLCILKTKLKHAILLETLGWIIIHWGHSPYKWYFLLCAPR